MFELNDGMRVGFRHYTKPFWNYETNKEQNGYTLCYISGIDEDNEVIDYALGMAHCSINDQFNRAIGRKVALADALKEFDDVEFRRYVWEKYFEANGGY